MRCIGVLPNSEPILPHHRPSPVLVPSRQSFVNRECKVLRLEMVRVKGCSCWRNEEARISLADPPEPNDQQFFCERGWFPSLDPVMPDESVLLVSSNPGIFQTNVSISPSQLGLSAAKIQRQVPR